MLCYVLGLHMFICIYIIIHYLYNALSIIDKNANNNLLKIMFQNLKFIYPMHKSALYNNKAI